MRLTVVRRIVDMRVLRAPRPDAHGRDLSTTGDHSVGARLPFVPYEDWFRC